MSTFFFVRNRLFDVPWPLRHLRNGRNHSNPPISAWWPIAFGFIRDSLWFWSILLLIVSWPGWGWTRPFPRVLRPPGMVNQPSKQSLENGISVKFWPGTVRWDWAWTLSFLRPKSLNKKLKFYFFISTSFFDVFGVLTWLFVVAIVIRVACGLRFIQNINLDPQKPSRIPITIWNQSTESLKT